MAISPLYSTESYTAAKLSACYFLSNWAAYYCDYQ